jgi:hypothetical protein
MANDSLVGTGRIYQGPIIANSSFVPGSPITNTNWFYEVLSEGPNGICFAHKRWYRAPERFVGWGLIDSEPFEKTVQCVRSGIPFQGRFSEQQGQVLKGLEFDPHCWHYALDPYRNEILRVEFYNQKLPLDHLTADELLMFMNDPTNASIRRKLVVVAGELPQILEAGDIWLLPMTNLALKQVEKIIHEIKL